MSCAVSGLAYGASRPSHTQTALCSGIGQGSVDVSDRELGIGCLDVGRCQTIGQTADDHGDGNTSAFDGGVAMMDVRVKDDVVLPLDSAHLSLFLGVISKAAWERKKQISIFSQHMP